MMEEMMAAPRQSHAPKSMPGKAGKKEIDTISIHPGENGGHMVRHSFKRTPVMRSGRDGGLGYDYPESEEHIFGPRDGEKMMGHLATHLGMKGAKTAKTEEE